MDDGVAEATDAQKANFKKKMAWRMLGGGGSVQTKGGGNRKGRHLATGTWGPDRTQASIMNSMDKRAAKVKKRAARLTKRMEKVIATKKGTYTPQFYAPKAGAVSKSVSKLRQLRTPKPKVLPAGNQGGWSNNKKLAVGAGVLAGTAAAYGGYRMWKNRKNKSKNESLLTSLDEIRELSNEFDYTFESNQDLLLALGEASETDDVLAEDLLDLVALVDNQLNEGKTFKSIAYGETPTEAGGVFGGFGHTLGAGLGTAAATGLASKKRRKKFFKFGRQMLGIKKMKKRPSDKEIKKMMAQVQHVSKAKRASLEKMLRSVASANKATGIPSRRGIAMGVGGGALLGAGAMYAYNKWKKSRTIADKNTKFQGARRGYRRGRRR